MSESAASPRALGAAGRGPDEESGGGHILVVDDNETNRDLLKRRLVRQGHTTAEAGDGQAALDVLAREEVDLVLLDIMMPGIDGYETLARIKAHEDWRHVPVIMISALTEMDSVVRCIKLGAADYLPKPFNPTLLKARVGACLERKRLRDQERRAYEALRESQAHLAAELAEAAAYVRSLLPPPLSGKLATDWQSVPSEQLGGDLFGYHWLDDDHFAIYLFDVSGHGVGAALLSVSVANTLRSRSLPNVDFGDPAAVLSGLNEAFPMESHNNMYFTAWYGVYGKTSRELAYASGGHPPAILVPPQGPAERLKTPGMIVGGMPDAPYTVARRKLEPGSALLVFSDGVYEVGRPDGSEMTLDEFVALALEASAGGRGVTEDVLARVRAIHGSPSFDDDFSILRVAFE